MIVYLSDANPKGVTMVEKANPTQPETVACEICLKEVPVSGATSDEVEGYVAHFCGLECYSQWKKQEKRDTPEAREKG
jgi:hypothetical protein